MTTQLTLVAPPPDSRVSGGNLYNAQLVAALRPLIPVRVIDDRTWLGESPRPGPSDARARIIDLPVAVVDSLYLSAIPRYLAGDPDVGLDVGPGASMVLLLAHLLPSHDRAAATEAQLDLEERVLRAVDGVVATSTYVRDTFRERGLPADRIITVAPALGGPVTVSSGMSGRPAPPGGGARVLLVGNAIPRKGFLEFLEQLAARVQADDDLTVDIVGHLDMDLDYAARCTDLAGTHPALAHRVMFHGPVAPGDMPVWYQRAALFVSSSRAETFGMAIQEARWVGLPVLVLRGGYVDAHVPDARVGSLHDDLGDLVERLLALVRTPARLRALQVSAAASRLAGDYTWERAARSFVDQLRAMRAR